MKSNDVDTIHDPHHGGANMWRFKNGKLYHNTEGSKKWVEVKSISFTVPRILAIAELIKVNNIK